MQASIRFASTSDAEQILAIYAPYIISTSVTFEADVPKLDEFKRQISTISSSMPYLVCEIDGKIAGFAYASENKSLSAYAWNAQMNVYIGNDYQRCNVASALYLAVISLLKAQGYKTVIALVTSDDGVSEAFHNSFGFEKIGTLTDIGFKLGKWHSMSIFSKQLTDSKDIPTPTKRVTELGPIFCQKNFRQCGKIIRA